MSLALTETLVNKLLRKLLKDDLELWHADQVLTQSGDVLLEVLQDRFSKWTEATLQSLYKNPQIIHLIEDMTVLISGK